MAKRADEKGQSDANAGGRAQGTPRNAQLFPGGGWWSWILAVLLLAGLIAAGVAAGQRWQAERANRTVDIVFDFEGAKEMAAAEGLPVGEVLRQLKEAGVTSVAVSERTLGDLSRTGEVEVISGQAILDAARLGVRLEEPWGRLWRAGLVDPRATYVAGGRARTDHPAGGGWDGLLARLKGVGVTVPVVSAGEPGGPVYRVDSNLESVYEVSVGFENAAIEQVARAGLGVALRPGNVAGADASMIADLFAALPAVRYTEAIFAGEEILGYPNNLEETARALKDGGLVFGVVEFAKQKGEKTLAALTGYQTVRVHSITEREIPGMTRDVAVERMLRAARERDMRALYLRPLPPVPAQAAVLAGEGGAVTAQPGAAVGPGTLAFNVEYVRQIADGLKRQGQEIGQAKPFAIIGAPMGRGGAGATASFLILMVMAAGVSAAGLYLIERLAAPWRGRFSRVAQAVLLLVALVGTAGLYLKGYTVLVRQLWALAAAVVFPTAAIWLTQLWWDTPKTQPGTAVAALGRLWLAAVISFAGALYVVGFLADTRFLLKVEEFAGVKLMHVIPLAVVAVLAVWVWLRDQPGTRPMDFLEAVWRYPLRLGHVVIALVALVGLAVYILRTGNQSILPVSDLERSARSFLETTLVVRPRTKEFLLGHPAFILAPFLLRDRRWAAWAIALALATIGQLSMVNTFTHIHTPLLISAWRGLNGLILGSVIGLVAVWVYERLSGGRSRKGREAGEGGSAG